MGVGYYFLCQQQMPGTAVSTGHTLQHNTAAFSASGHGTGLKGEGGEEQRKMGNKQEANCARRNRGNMKKKKEERGRNKG